MVLEGYNIVGDGTPQALLPILTGGWRMVGWDPTGTAAYTHRWVEGGGRHGAGGIQHSGGWKTTGTATYTYRWVEGGGMGPHRHCYLYSQVGGGWWEAWCWRDTI